MSPWFKLYGYNLDIFSLKVFGCPCYPYLRPYSQHKHNHRIAECIFLGYSNVSKGYLCLDLLTNKLYTCRHVLFSEHRFPFPLSSFSVTPFHPPTPDIWLSNLLYLHSSNQLSILSPYPTHTSTPTHQSSTLLPLPVSNSTPPISDPSLASAHNPSSQSHSPSSSLLQPTPLPTTLQSAPLPTTLEPASLSHPLAPSQSIPPTSTSSQVSTLASVNTNPMTTRSKNGISKPKLCYKAVLDYTHTEPPSYKVASKFPQWVQAMDEEFSALQIANLVSCSCST